MARTAVRKSAYECASSHEDLTSINDLRLALYRVKSAPKTTTVCDSSYPSHRLYNAPVFDHYHHLSLRFLPQGNIIEQRLQGNLLPWQSILIIHCGSSIRPRPFTFPIATTPTSAHLKFSRILSSSQIWHQLLSMDSPFAFLICPKTYVFACMIRSTFPLGTS